LLLALLATTLMIMILLRRVGVGLIAMIPNVLPLLVLGGVAGWAWGRVDANIILIAMIAVGIAVDDTVHFLTRFRIESERHEPGVALRRTLSYAGHAMLETTLILCLGFLPFAISEHTTTRMMGTLLPLTLVVALIADLLLLPALGAVGLLRYEAPTRSSERRNL
jgi:predicted RND superfamily exporter protein